MPPPLPSEASLPKKRNASGAYHDANQRRFPESSHAVQSIFQRRTILAFFCFIPYNSLNIFGYERLIQGE